MNIIPYAADSSYIFNKIKFAKQAIRDSSEPYSYPLYENFPKIYKEIFFNILNEKVPKYVVESGKPEDKILGWSLATIAKSALYRYLTSCMNSRKSANKPEFDYHDWIFITPILLNAKVSKKIANMLQIFYFCPYKVKVSGIRNALLFTIGGVADLNVEITPKSVANLLGLYGH